MVRPSTRTSPNASRVASSDADSVGASGADWFAARAHPLPPARSRPVRQGTASATPPQRLRRSPWSKSRLVIAPWPRAVASRQARTDLILQLGRDADELETANLDVMG